MAVWFKNQMDCFECATRGHYASPVGCVICNCRNILYTLCGEEMSLMLCKRKMKEGAGGLKYSVSMKYPHICMYMWRPCWLGRNFMRVGFSLSTSKQLFVGRGKVSQRRFIALIFPNLNIQIFRNDCQIYFKWVHKQVRRDRHLIFLFSGDGNVCMCIQKS